MFRGVRRIKKGVVALNHWTTGSKYFMLEMQVSIIQTVTKHIQIWCSYVQFLTIGWIPHRLKNQYPSFVKKRPHLYNMTLPQMTCRNYLQKVFLVGYVGIHPCCTGTQVLDPAIMTFKAPWNSIWGIFRFGNGIIPEDWRFVNGNPLLYLQISSTCLFFYKSRKTSTRIIQVVSSLLEYTPKSHAHIIIHNHHFSGVCLLFGDGATY